VLDAIQALDDNMKFATDDEKMVGCVQINVSLPLSEVEGADPEELRARLRDQMIEFLYGEFKEELQGLSSMLELGDEWVCAQDAVVEPLNAILDGIGEED